MSFDEPINYDFALEKTELESFCSVMLVEEKEALTAIHKLKIFLNIEEYLSFEKLKRGRL